MHEALTAWARRNRRDLPWRRTRDPWAILVSEAMLQQTQAARVVPRYHGFLARFPTVGSCAAAPAGDVIAEWSGLGYNRRALNLHRAAAVVADRHDGVVPDDLGALLALPGVGTYTARAVLVFAFEHDHGVLDTNAARVLARTAGRRLTASEAQARADALVPVGAAWAWNQAMLDLGATVCVARAPRCDVCPLTASCVWHRAGRPAPDPAVGSAGTSGRQSPFHGSDRQGRGRLVAALRHGEVARTDLAATMGWPDDPARAERVALTLVADGLIAMETGGGRFSLPAG